jgi:hypothetical protein
MAGLKIYTIERVYLPTQTLGSWYDKVTRELICKTLELPWRNNKRSSNAYEASCIPEKTYRVTWSPAVLADDPRTLIDESGGRKARPYEHFVFHDTEPRQGILAHRITNVEGLLGCIGVGSRFANLDSDPDYEMVESAATLQWMCDHMPKEFLVEITKKLI